MEAKDAKEEDGKVDFEASEIEYESYGGEHHLPLIMNLVDEELSEPYSIFTYRYFVYLWPHLSFLAFHKGKCVGTVVCKMGEHRGTFRGYIAMLVVLKPYRGKGIATELVTRSITVMMESGCEEVTLEAEVTNKGALALYGRLGFVRAKRLFRYYLNGVDAFRLKLLFPRPESQHFQSMLATMDESGSRWFDVAELCRWILRFVCCFLMDLLGSIWCHGVGVCDGTWGRCSLFLSSSLVFSGHYCWELLFVASTDDGEA
nr:N-alpha-acetyltransferase MAK3 [Ipomoea batatas]GME10629.1 N-alpha-acetyltransferase MAK3 [Ipomoea batatas]